MFFIKVTGFFRRYEVTKYGKGWSVTRKTGKILVQLIKEVFNTKLHHRLFSGGWVLVHLKDTIKDPRNMET